MRRGKSRRRPPARLSHDLPRRHAGPASRPGTLTPDGAIHESRDAVGEREGEVKAFVHRDLTAHAAPSGPLAGIAVGVKDIIDTADMPTQMGSSIYADWRPRADAPVVAALRRAGATLIGKTATTAFASSDPAPTRNPRNLDHTPGGSSAGSAAAVAAGMVHLALGTQTAGSVIRPAAYCGVAAIKPSFRLIPTVGIKSYAWTLDTVGLFAASVADVAAALAIVSGRPMPIARMERPRIGIVTQDFAGAPDSAAEAALERAAALLEKAGAEVTSVAPPAPIGEGWAAHPTIQDHEGATSFAWEYDAHRAELPPLIGGQLDRGRAIGAEAYDDARRIANRARAAAKDLFRGLDALVTYAAPGAAPRGLESTGDPRFNRIWTLLGTPCVNVPALILAGGLPVGVQIVAPFAQDAAALSIAAMLEHAARPPQG